MGLFNLRLKAHWTKETNKINSTQDEFSSNEDHFKTIFKDYFIDNKVEDIKAFKKISNSLNTMSIKMSDEIYTLSSLQEQFLKLEEATKSIRIIRCFYKDIQKLNTLEENELIELCNIIDRYNEPNEMKNKLIRPLNKLIMQKMNEELLKPPAICNVSKFLKFVKEEVLMALKIKYLQNRCKIMEIYAKKNPHIFFEILKNELINFSNIFLIDISINTSKNLLLFKDHFLTLFMTKSFCKFIKKNQGIDFYKTTNHLEEEKYQSLIVYMLEEIGYKYGEIIKTNVLNL